ncbi:MAG: M56 family metallopeptidase [Bacteroidota bacterium]
MTSLIPYWLEVILTSIIFYSGFLIIRKVTNPTIRRYYLLSTLLLIVLLPMIQLDISIDYLPDHPVSISTQSMRKASDLDQNKVLDTSHSTTFFMDIPKMEEAVTIDWWGVLTVGYFVIVMIFLLKMGIAIVSLFYLKKNAHIKIFEGHIVHVVKKTGFSGASFFGVIFIGEEIFKSQDLSYILKHEQVHSERLHTLDILLADIFRALFWLNPLAWFYRSALRHTTELETDYLVTQVVDPSKYAHLLVSLSGSSCSRYILNNFSSFRVKSRLFQMAKPVENKWSIALATFVLAISMSFFMVSCQSESEDVLLTSDVIGDVKSITSTFTSHQQDTQEKNSRIVAVATFNTDGSLDAFNQHLTYPYNLEYVEPRSFWSQPNPNNLHFIMDGLDLEYAENNLLYGNAWPGKFAQLAEVSHPRFENKEWREYSTRVTYSPQDLPTEIITETKIAFKNISTSSWIERFEYIDRKVSLFSFNQEFKESAGNTTRVSWVSASKPKQIKYNYEGDDLVAVQFGNRALKFTYENSLLVRSELWIGEKLYNTRRYIYHENGLKKQTNIFNLYGEPEYTIGYSYEFY